MRSLSLPSALALVLLLSAGLRADAPWPQFRGPGGSGVAADGANPPVEVGVDTNVAWKIAVPAGLSSPVVVGDLVVLTAFDDGKLFTVAYRQSDGGEAWRAEAPYEKLEPYHKTEGSPAASTCATDGQSIVSYFGSCGLFCYDLAGFKLWDYPLPAAATIADFGTGVSPVIADASVVLLRDEASAPMILAVDLATGQRKWMMKRTSKSGYGTPAVWHTDAGTQIAAPGYGRLVGYDLADGAERWFVEGMPAASCTTPVVDGDMLYYAAWSPGDSSDDGGYKMPTYDELLGQNDKDKDGVFQKSESVGGMFENFFDNNDANKDGEIRREEWAEMLAYMANSVNSAFALSAGGEGDVTKSHVKWREKDGLPYVPSPILHRGQLLMVKDGGIVTAYDAASGKRLYQKRAVATGSYYASPVAAGDHVYFASLADGAITVLKAGAPKPETVAENKPLGERLSATPAIVGDALYVRTAGHLWKFASQ